MGRGGEGGTDVVEGTTPEVQEQVQDVDHKCIEWIKSKLSLLTPPEDSPWRYGAETPEDWVAHVWDASWDLIVSQFLLSLKAEECKIFFVADTQDISDVKIYITNEIPQTFSQLIYFLRDHESFVNVECIAEHVQFGEIKSTVALEGLLHLMQDMYVPWVHTNNAWPDTVKKDFVGHMHKFMANLTESVYDAKGKTELYIPMEEGLKDPVGASKQKDLLQRLESTIIHWTRQIKEVINVQDSAAGSDSDKEGPLHEIELWRSRNINLSGIRQQLDHPSVSDIVAVLEQAKSSYLSPFLNLRNLIQREAIAAEDNLKFLLCLENPCQTLSKATPSEIPPILPHLLNCIRMVWNISRFYNTPERLTGLLRKVSNEIIERCCSVINLDDIFGGDISKVMGCLRESIDAGIQWKKVYHDVAAAVSAKSSSPWDFDSSSIFAHIDAFVQRCRDLLEICEAQLQFAPRKDLPVFGGNRGPEITKSILDIQSAFQKQINILRNLEYSILDVKATRWHDDYNDFKSSVKDLEVMLTNTIMLAFETVGSLKAFIDLLESFQSIAQRESIKRCVEKKTSEFCSSYMTELNEVKKKFDHIRRHPPLTPHLPPYSGTATWVMTLMNRVDKIADSFQAVRHMLPNVLLADEVMVNYNVARESFSQYIETLHKEWTESIDPECAKRLENNLLLRDRSQGGLLMMNFDQTLLTMFTEVHYWERLRFSIPLVAMEIQAQREKYRVLRENVLRVVRDYNKVLSALDKEERRLFQDRIQHLDRRIIPGVNKLQWTSLNHHLEYFTKEAVKYCRDGDVTVTAFKAANRKIEENCKLIAETLLVSVEKKKLYDHAEFEKLQVDHRGATQGRFQRAYEEIKKYMASTYQIFGSDSEDVQREWLNFTRKIDKKLEDALRTTVKKSLQELSRVLNGDKKNEVPIPIFNVRVQLEKSNRVELRPTVQDLFNMVHTVSREMVTVISCLPRIAEQLTTNQKAEYAARPDLKPPAPLPSFYDIISADEDTTLKTIAQITTGITSIVEKVQHFLNYWEKKYKHMWDQDKEAYIRRYEKARKPLSSFEEDITKYLELQDEVLSEDTSTSMRFLHVDCAPLKQALVGHCEAWVAKFTGLLNSLAATELRELHDYFMRHTRALQRTPSNLDQLAEGVNLQRKLVTEKETIEARFEPLQEKYRALKNYDYMVPDQEMEQLDQLPGAWSAFQLMLDSTAGDLERAKDSFRERLVKMVDTFVKEVEVSRVEFEKQAPYSHEKTDTEAAFMFIKSRTQSGEGARKKSKDLKAGMDIFGIPQPPYKELAANEKELETLTAIWTVVKDWEESYSGWKDGKFKEIMVEDMETAAVGVGKRVTKLGREIKHWPVWTFIKDTVDAFKKTMPLVIDLRNPALRPRHWDQVMDQVGKRFDPFSDDFTLDSVVKLGLSEHAEFIMELSTNSTKELAIENSINSIAEAWETLELDMVEYKATSKLRSTEDVYAALEDNIVTLSTMKASKFFVVFEKQITHWEQTLSLVSEMVEIILQVQRNWMYLENIFIGSEDIRKQLPQESIMFDNVHNTFQIKMREIADISNCVKACCKPGMLDTFNDMDAKLEKIQKSLENYLENKRQQFPRFYFLSSDDLLEILGQAKDPQNVQSHLKKCFEGIKKLEMNPPGSDGRRHWESTGVFSPDGEYLPFISLIVTEGRPEEWLNRVEEAMFATTKKTLYKVLEDSKAVKKEKWVKENQGQCIISAGQMVWTMECEKALGDSEHSTKAVRQLKKKWVSYLNKLTGITRSKLTKIERNKTVSLITIEVHARDVIEKLGKTGASSPNDFEWVSQLRFYWDKDQNDCVVKQVLSVFVYGYEYQGNNGRLVITPLTDRCYMTLGAALFTRRGGNPLGPAGTGKTETVKDFGKALARYVIVFNCSDGVDYKMTGKMFSGLAQTGAWTCLDEFNRIEVEVLSVVATQINIVMQAIKERKTRFNFLGQEIRLIPTCGIFVTMNPGYAGRSELPDNLKAIVRPVSMMVPDFTLISEIMMFSEGFSTAKVLAKKMIAIMELSQQQLSKQDHYDYGLRSFVIPIARAAGALKRLDPDASEEVIMYRTMIDLIKPKLVYLDLPLFMALLSDLFPGVELPANDGGELRKALEADLNENNLQVVNDFIIKIIQVFDCKVARHGNMIVGKTGSGKSVAWQTLTRSMKKLRETHPDNEHYQKVSVHTINPLALSNDEMYGCFDPGTHEWTDGILARIMRTICKDEGADQKWILFDGPVDTLWIESMNTTLDDNKLLTLLSGERISMPPQVSLLFEVEDLSQASPATVSRAGMIYLNVEDLGWRPMVTSWMALKKEPVIVETLWKCIEKFMEASLEFKRLNCKELVPVDRLSSVRDLMRIFDSFGTEANGVSAAEGPEAFVTMVELWFIFAVIWGIGGSLDEAGRKTFDSFLREMDTRFPPSETVYEYFVDHKTKTWHSWEQKLSTAFKPQPGMPFFKILVPTVDTVRTRFLAEGLVKIPQHLLITGNVGVGKTMVVQQVLENLPERKAPMTINFSAATTSNSLQETIEGRLEKRSKGVFAPAGGKHLVCFIDDLNMPQKSVFGFIPPLELLKLWADNGFWYDRQKQEVKNIRDIQLIGSMAPPGGGRNPFSQRVQAVFSVINMTAPNDGQLKRIFGVLLNSKLHDFDDEIKPLGDLLTQATIEIYRAVAKDLLPTPSKSHYLFNTRDIAKIVQGVMQANKTYYDSKEIMMQLWCHETFRIIGDRMWDANDKKWLQNQLDEKLTSLFSTSWNALFEPTDGVCPPFITFMRQVDNPPYEPCTDAKGLKENLTEKLEDYALEPGNSAMDLVLFNDAIQHVCRIHRIICQPRGNALLVGVGGSGRKSLCRLATYVAEQKCFMIEIGRNYRSVEFRDDLKVLYRQAGVENKPTVFLFDETQIVEESFVEYINNILTSGEVPNLFTKDELPGVLDEVRGPAKAAGAGETADALYSFFLEQVRTNLHVVLCLSPIGDGLRERCRMFPGLVNCCVIDWFTEWPADALYEVAAKQLEHEDLGTPQVKDAVCQVFVTAHQSVATLSVRMLEMLKRQNYVTPTNYLETVRGYRALLAEKRAELGEKARKLKGGLEKLEETKIQVGEMSKVAEEKKVVVAEAKQSCEELLVEIVQDKRVADEQEKQVNAEATKIGKEAEEADAIAKECQEGLDKAMPALQAAESALNVLTKKDMSELKAYAKPPALVELTLNGVMTVLKRPATWEECKKQLGDANFMGKLLDFDKDKLDDGLLKKIGKFTNNPDYQPDVIAKVSGAAKGLCLWVRAMETYGRVSKEVAPKRAKLKAAQDLLSKKQAALKVAQDQLAEVLAKVEALKSKYDESTASKKKLEDELEDLEGKLIRAEKLVSGLAGERDRWEASIAQFEHEISLLPGDVVVAAAFMAYAGPFPSEYREELISDTWLPQVRNLNIPASEQFNFALFLANPSDVRDWNIQGLPADSFSTENGVMVTRSPRWPLMIDPQGQANKWVKRMEEANQVKVLNLNMSDLARQVENAIQFGNPVVLQDVLETIDPVLEPLLAKAFIKRGNQTLIKLGDKEVDYNFDFRLYITTKLANPHYTPEISTKVALVNFIVKEQGLEAQLLNTVVKNERPDLDKQKNDLVVKVAQGKRTQVDLEDQILYMLSTATGSLLDNVELINTLDQSKTTWEEVNESLKIAEETSKKIEATSLQYRPCSIRAAVLYFVLNDLAGIDPMYQFSLDAYNDLFLQSINKSAKSEDLQERIKSLNDFHTYAVYKYTSRGLFERHKLLLSLQMCVRILQTAKQVNNEEYQFFLKGGIVLDRSQQPNNPAPAWISELAWDNICELENLPNFKGVLSSLEQNVGGWEMWYRTAEPETAELPGDWESTCNELQRMIFVRCLRPDRVVFAATSFVTNALGRKYVEPPVLDLKETHADSTALSPLIFVLSPGVDPTENLRKLAEEKGLGDRFFSVALGQGQAPVATKLIEDGLREGNWVFLANCHLMTSWLPELDKLIEGFEKAKPHENFRLWLSSNPSDKFPIAILQRGIKMTTEPPKGLRANLQRLYNTVTDESFAECKTQNKYQKLLFALTYFHSVLLERRKFRSLGLNIPYDFNDTDYKVSDDLLKSYLDYYEETPWDALKYLISEANYGGRVTDELDRRVLASYLNQFYCEEALSTPNYPLSPLPMYFIPEANTLSGFKDYISTLPSFDRPEAFGQHPNADISYQIEDSRVVLDSLLSLQPQTSSAAGGMSTEQIVTNIANDILDQVPGPFNLEAVMKAKSDDPSALHVVLFQEIERYNMQLVKVRANCTELLKGIKGLVVMSSDLDAIFNALANARVPAAWLKAYPSLKPLGAWTRDLLVRIEQLAVWVEDTYPKVYWLSGFTYPTGFLTAVLQTTARKNSIPIDTLSFEFSIVNLDEKEILHPPKEGVYVKGMFLEGGGWDFENGCLCEPEAMELVVHMPILLFKPVENKKRSQKGIYICPLYMYPLRTGSRERPSFMINVDLKSGTSDPDHWIKRGTALLLSLAV